MASSLDDAPWPASKEELIDYANRSGAPEEVIENLEELEGGVLDIKGPAQGLIIVTERRETWFPVSLCHQSFSSSLTLTQ